MSLALNPNTVLQEVAVRAANQRSRSDGPTIALGVIIFALLLLANLIPAIRYPNAIVALGIAWFIWTHRKSHPSF